MITFIIWAASCLMFFVWGYWAGEREANKKNKSLLLNEDTYHLTKKLLPPAEELGMIDKELLENLVKYKENYD